MSHTYADVETFKRYIVSGDGSGWTGDDAALLTFLEGASRRIDEWCDRSWYGSGFGPRVGTNTYDTAGWCADLNLDDDVLAITQLTVDAVATTEYRLLPRGKDQKREAQFLAGSAGTVVAVTGTFGYSNESVAIGTAAVGAGSAATTIALGGGVAYAGHTLVTGSQQMYVTASGGGTALTVVRGVNGTTGGTVVLGDAISKYVYPADVVTATMQLAQRRYRSAQAGVTGDFGSGTMPVVGHRDSERSILLSLQGKRHYGAG